MAVVKLSSDNPGSVIQEGEAEEVAKDAMLLTVPR